MKSIVFGITFFFFVVNGFSQEKKMEFTKEEFNTAVMAEMNKNMKKIGRGKMIPFSQELLSKELLLEKKEKEMKVKEDQLKVHEEQLKVKVIEFKNEQEKFISCIDKIDQDEKNRISHMVDVVSNMRPINAASLLSQQDSEISVKILARLEPVKVSKIFNLMEKEVSARLQKQYMTMKR